MPLSQENRVQMALSASISKKKKFDQKRELLRYFASLKHLLRRLKGIKPWSKTRANGLKLYSIEEEVLLKRLLKADKQGFPIQPEFLRGMAQILLRERLQDHTTSLGINWAYKFTKRHPEIRTRYTRRMTYQRARQEDSKVIISWFQIIYAAIQEHSIHEDDIWNFDETGFIMGLCSTSKVVTAVDRSVRPRRVIQGNREWVTIIETISSKGIHVPRIIILKASY
jgi:hypothetical protein